MNPLYDGAMEAEVLACPLVDPASWPLTADLLSGEDFTHTAHRSIFHAMGRLWATRGTIDLPLLQELLRGDEGARLVLLKLMDRVGQGDHLEQYAAVLREKTHRRRISSLGDYCQAVAQDTSRSIDEIAESIEGHLDFSSPTGPEIVSAGDAASSWADWVQEDPAQRAQNLLSTGLLGLDRYLGGGVPSGSLVGVLAAPSMGKTALAVNNLVWQNAVRGTQCTVFTMETTARNLFGRLISRMSGVPLHVQLRGLDYLSDGDRHHWSRGYAEACELPISLVEGRHTLSEVCRMVRAQVRKVGCKLWVVDFLQLVRADRDWGTTERELQEAVYTFQDLANRTDTVGVVLVQPDKMSRLRRGRLTLADCRGASAIEDALYLGLLPYRPWQHDKEAPKMYAEVAIAKWKDGPVGTIGAEQIRWNGARMCFEDLDAQSHWA